MFAVGGGGPDAVDGAVLHHFEADLFEVEPQVGHEDLVDGEDLVQPAQRRVNRLVGPLLGRVVVQEFDHDLADFTARQPGRDRFAQPEEALLEGGEDLDFGGVGVGAGVDEAFAGFGGDALADLGRFGEAGLEAHRFPVPDAADDAFVEGGPEAVHFGGHFKLVVDDGGRVLHVTVVDGDGDLGRDRVREVGERPVTHEIGNPAGGFPQRHENLGAGDPLALLGQLPRELGHHLVQLVEPEGRLSPRGVARERAPRVRVRCRRRWACRRRGR